MIQNWFNTIDDNPSDNSTDSDSSESTTEDTMAGLSSLFESLNDGDSDEYDFDVWALFIFKFQGCYAQNVQRLFFVWISIWECFHQL